MTPRASDPPPRDPETQDSILAAPTADADPHEAATLHRASAPARSPASDPPLARLGTFEIVREIARGGMGVVYEARDERFAGPVALKVIRELPEDASVRAEVVARFRREAALAARLHHPGIIAIHEVGEATPEGGGPVQYYIAMELIRGRSLSAAAPTLSPDEGVRIVARVADAVAHAHDHGVIHRDLKLANVLLADDGRVIVTDFGLARHTDDTTLTQSGAVMGTAAYMAPEQVEGDRARIGPASDVWALGVMLYLLIARRPPFEGRSAPEVYVRILQQDPAPLTTVAPGVSPALAAICHQALERSPARRYASATPMAADLARALAGEAVRARAVSPLRRLGRRLTTRPALLGMVALACAVASAAAAWQAGVSDRAQRFDELASAAADAARDGRWDAARAACTQALALGSDPQLEDLARRVEHEIVLARQVELERGRAEEARLAAERQRTAAAAESAKILGEVASLRAEIRAVRDAIDTGAGDLDPIVLRVGALSDALPTLEAYTAGPELAATAAPWEALGELALALGDYERACGAMARVVSGSTIGRLVQAHVDLAAFAVVGAEGRSPAARRRAIEAWRARAETCLRRDLGADSDPSAAIAASTAPAAAHLRACAAWSRGDGAAAEIARGAIDLADPPRSADLYLLLGLLEHDRRAAHWARALAMRPWDARLLYLAAMDKVARSPEEALIDISRALRLAPRLAPALVERAALRATLGDVSAALADLELAASILPGSAQPRLRRALLREASHPALALADAAAAVALDPRDVEALACRARLLAGAGRHTEALLDHRARLAFDPDDWSAWVDVGDTLELLGRREEAHSAFAKALDLTPDDRKGEVEVRLRGAR